MVVSLRKPWGYGAILLLLLFALSACSTGPYGRSPSNKPGAAPHYKVGKPYRVKGKLYHPAEDPDYEAYGVASWYGRDFHGKLTANGERFDMNRLSAAHTTLPMPSLVEVTNISNGRRIVVRVNDRGPFADNRLIDLSREAARQLGFERKGLSRVRVRYVGPAPLLAKAPRANQRLVDRPSRAPLSRTTRASTRFVLGEAKRSAARVVAPILASATPTPTPLTPTISVSMAPASMTPVSMPPATKPPTSLTPTSTAQTSSRPATSVPPANPVPKSSSGPLYLIRVAALSRLDNIEVLKEQLKGIGQLRLSRSETGSGIVLYRINMGPFASLETANKRLEAVRGAGYKDAGLITLNP